MLRRRVALMTTVLGLVVVALMVSPVGAAPIVSSVLPSVTSPRAVGTPVTWIVAATGSGTLDYRFSIKSPDDTAFRIVRDFRSGTGATTLEWMALIEGTWTLRVAVRDNNGTTTATDETFTYSSPITGTTAVVTSTVHPLVAIYSVPPCATGTEVRIEFKADADASWQTTPRRECLGTRSVSSYIAGMRPTTLYRMRHVTRTSGVETITGDAMSFTTGALPSTACASGNFTTPCWPGNLTIAPTVVSASAMSTADGIIWYSAITDPSTTMPLPFGTDLSGNVVWYDRHFHESVIVSTQMTPDESLLGIVSTSPADGEMVQGVFVREYDLAGYAVRETNITRIREQLSSLCPTTASMSSCFFGAVDHEIVRLPDGRTAIELSEEQVVDDTAFPTSKRQPPDDMSGNAVAVLDADFQIVWLWRSFSHLDASRKANPTEICLSTSAFEIPGCPPIFLGGSFNAAEDWLHGNAISWSPADGNLIFSSRNQDWVLKLPYQNGAGGGAAPTFAGGAPIWKLGPTRSGETSDFAFKNQDGATATGYPENSHQHGAMYLGDDIVSIFDNGNTRCSGDSSCQSRGLVFRLNESVGSRTATRLLSWNTGGYSMALGSSQKLTTGNYLFTSGAQFDENGVGFAESFEVTAGGTLVYKMRLSGYLYRSYRMASMYRSWNDSDFDGMPDSWEEANGLDPRDSLGINGASGDGDGDGITNIDEYNAGSSPSVSSYYLAEGATISPFSTRIALLNPGTTSAIVNVSFMVKGQTTPVAMSPFSLAAGTRTTIDPATDGGLGAAEFSTLVTSSEPIVVDRTMRWSSASGEGAHAETAVSGPGTRWFLAEGATLAGFQLFYLVQNPGSTAAAVTVRYLRNDGQVFTKLYAVPANARYNIWVNAEAAGDATLAGLASAEFSADITSTQPVIVERAMYRDIQLGGGHNSAGVTSPQLSWFLAEGATGSFFDLFVLIANPNASAARVSARYLTTGGSVYTKTYTVPAYSRTTIWVDAESVTEVATGTTSQPFLTTGAVSTTLTSIPYTSESTLVAAQPIVVERAMWWRNGSGGALDASGWYEAHNSPGSVETGTKWGMADGEVGNASGPTSFPRWETYVAVANTSVWAGRAQVTVCFEDGTSSSRLYELPPNSRVTVPIGSADLTDPGSGISPEGSGFGTTVLNRRFGVIVESIATSAPLPPQIAVERAMYGTTTSPRFWPIGSNALATKLQ